MSDFALHRRRALQVSLGGMAGWSLAELAQASPASSTTHTADSVLFLNLAGGPSHLDTLDVKPTAPVETRGEFGVISSKVPSVPVCEHLPRTAAVLDQFTLIRGISHTTGDHPQGQAYIATGNRPTPALRYPSFGSIVTKELANDPELPSYVAVPTTEWGAGYMGDAYAPFSTNAIPKRGQPFSVRGLSLPTGLTVEKVQRREKLLARVDRGFGDANSELVEALDQFGQQAFKMITSAKTRQAFDVSQEPESIQRLFGADDLGQSLLLSLRLIESGVQFVTVTNQGWDTHLDNFQGHRRLLGPLDAALPALLQAMRSKGLLDRTLVVVMGEFGRTPRINENAGRDHFPRANWCLLAGGGAKPGLVGGTNEEGSGPDDDTDIKPDDLGASILHALGIDPETEYYTRTGRPVGLIPQGRLLKQAFA